MPLINPAGFISNPKNMLWIIILCFYLYICHFHHHFLRRPLGYIVQYASMNLVFYLTLLLYTLRTLKFSDEEFAQECLEYDEGIGDSPTRYFTNDGDVTQTSPLQYKRPIFSRSCSAPFGVPSSIHPGEGTNLKFVHQNRKVPHIKITDFSALDLEVNSSRHSG